jgi:hypothetical protein
MARERLRAAACSGYADCNTKIDPSPSQSNPVVAPFVSVGEQGPPYDAGPDERVLLSSGIDRWAYNPPGA